MPCGHAIARKEWINLSGSSWGVVRSESLHLVRFRGEGVLAQRLQQGMAAGKHGSPNSTLGNVHKETWGAFELLQILAETEIAPRLLIFQELKWRWII